MGSMRVFWLVLEAGLLVGAFRNPVMFRQLKHQPTKPWAFDGDHGSSSPDISERLQASDFAGAYQALKRNPMLQISEEDARTLLNNMRSLVPAADIVNDDNSQKQLIESCTFLYKRLEKGKTLKGFGCIDGEYPEKSVGEITPAKLQLVTGLNITALTPKQRQNYWTLAGIGLCAIQYGIGESLGLDPLYTTIPATFAALAIDQLFYRGAVFESIYQKLFPEYKQKIICHEAGHFLISYLLGIPIRGCVTNAWDAQKYPEINGQAGTIFFDPKLADELAAQKVTRSSVDRMSIVLMAGIAAEALKFGKAEGGVVDEKALVSFLTSFSPPWNVMRIQGQARWAAMQAILLIREHQASYDALVKALEEGNGVGDAVLAIEQNLPSSLPALQRVEDRKQKKKTMELDMLMRYIQKVTWRVGGIAPVAYDGNVIKGRNPHESKIVSGALLDDLSEADLGASGSAVVGMDGYIMGVKRAAAAAATGEGSVQSAVSGSGSDSGVVEVDGDDAVGLFKEKIHRLEVAAKEGKLDGVERNETGGGVWLNGLTAMKPGVVRVGGVGGAGEGGMTPGGNIVLPPPVEGYEERIEALRKAEIEAGVLVPDEGGFGGEGGEGGEGGAPSGTAESATADATSTTTSTATGADSSAGRQVDWSIPLMQSATSKLRSQDDILTSAGMDYLAPSDMLASKRGYQVKRLENIQAGVSKKIGDTKERIAELNEQIGGSKDQRLSSFLRR